MLQPITTGLALVVLMLAAAPLAAYVYEDFPFDADQDWIPEPFDVVSSHPLYMTLLNPMPRSGRVLDSGHTWFSVQSEFSSIHLESRGRGQEQVFFDNELVSLNFHARVGLPYNFDLGAAISFNHFSGGFLDEELIEYHEFWGLPDARGERSARDEFHGLINDSTGRRAFDVQPHGLRPGNLNLMLAYNPLGSRMGPDSNFWFSPRLQVKLPTADKGSGLNSGSPDIAFGFATRLGLANAGIDFNADLVIPMGFDWKGTSDFEADPFLSVMAGVYMALSRRVVLRVQTHWSNQAFEVPAGLQDSFENPALILFGGFIKLGRGELMVAFTEDLSEGSEVDFKLSVGWRMGF